jgi:hypothetical protein
MPALVAALVALAVGYGVGRFQGNVAVQAVQEKLETAQSGLKTAQEGMAAVEKRSARLMGRRYIDVAVQKLDGGDVRAARFALGTAAKWFVEGTIDSTKPFADQLETLSKSNDLASKKAELKALGEQIDSQMPVPTPEGGSVR